MLAGINQVTNLLERVGLSLGTRISLYRIIMVFTMVQM